MWHVGLSDSRLIMSRRIHTPNHFVRWEKGKSVWLENNSIFSFDSEYGSVGERIGSTFNSFYPVWYGVGNDLKELQRRYNMEVQCLGTMKVLISLQGMIERGYIFWRWEDCSGRVVEDFHKYNSIYSVYDGRGRFIEPVEPKSHVYPVFYVINKGRNFDGCEI